MRSSFIGRVGSNPTLSAKAGNRVADKNVVSHAVFAYLFLLVFESHVRRESPHSTRIGLRSPRASMAMLAMLCSTMSLTAFSV